MRVVRNKLAVRFQQHVDADDCPCRPFPQTEPPLSAATGESAWRLPTAWHIISLGRSYKYLRLGTGASRLLQIGSHDRIEVRMA